MQRNVFCGRHSGIGGDDRCGVYAILKICEKYKPHVLFTTDEETGGKGALAFNKCFGNIELKKHINFIIEIDRRGCNQAVFYNCGNKEFQEYILSFGFEKQEGTFTDISLISPVFDIASVNFSAGYYNEHQKVEYINLNDLDQTIEKVINILEDKEHHKYYDYQRKTYEYATIPRYVVDDWRKLSSKQWAYYYGGTKPKTYHDLRKWYFFIE